MKPEWKKAPKWANYLAISIDGRWLWYAEKPNLGTDGFWYSSAEEEFAEERINLKESLEKRP